MHYPSPGPLLKWAEGGADAPAKNSPRPHIQVRVTPLDTTDRALGQAANPNRSKLFRDAFLKVRYPSSDPSTMELTKERATVAILVLMERRSIEAYGRTDYAEMRAPKRSAMACNLVAPVRICPP